MSKLEILPGPQNNMAITTHIDRAKDLTTFTATDVLTIEMVMPLVEEFYAGETTKCVLWDLLNVTKNRITLDQAETILYLKQRYAGKKGSGKTAIVAHDDFFYGISRSMAMQSNLQGATYTVLIFNDLNVAYKWLYES